MGPSIITRSIGKVSGKLHILRADVAAVSIRFANVNPLVDLAYFCFRFVGRFHYSETGAGFEDHNQRAALGGCLTQSQSACAYRF